MQRRHAILSLKLSALLIILVALLALTLSLPDTPFLQGELRKYTISAMEFLVVLACFFGGFLGIFPIIINYFWGGAGALDQLRKTPIGILIAFDDEEEK